jgi:PUB domain
MSVNLDLTNRLEKNQKVAYINGVTIFLKLLTNIIENPTEEKYRKFKRANQRISNELLSLDGIEEIIVDAGFEVDGDEFVLRRGGLGVISKLKMFRDFFQKRLEVIASSQTTLISPLSSIPSTSTGVIKKVVSPANSSFPAVRIVADKSFQERIRFPQVLTTTNSFLGRLEHLSDSVMQYEDVSLQNSGLQLMPTEKFRLNAMEKLRKLQKMIKSKEIVEIEPSIDDLILEELAEWFKHEFFTWVNSMPCRRCKNENTHAMGTRIENGVRIEVS